MSGRIKPPHYGAFDEKTFKTHFSPLLAPGEGWFLCESRYLDKKMFSLFHVHGKYYRTFFRVGQVSLRDIEDGHFHLFSQFPSIYWPQSTEALCEVCDEHLPNCENVAHFVRFMALKV